ncbi:MAG: PAS domain S-box protein [Chloroflexi bacterium]|nr:PAS domain S-box protein [Chloroflexota bacterium]
MPDPIRLLLLEDNPIDAELVTHNLRKAGLQFDLECVDTEADFTEQCQANCPDLILADFSLPAFDGFSALLIAKRICPHVPFIFVSGVMGEENAIASLQLGATDYVLKQRITRLPSAVTRALREAQERRDLQRAEQELAQSQQLKTEIVESIRDGLFTLDYAWRFTYVNHRALEILGSDAAQLIGINLWDKYPEFLGTPLERHYRQAMMERVPSSFETQVARTGASYAVRVYPSVEGISVYWIDITERKQAEEALRTSEALLRAVLENNPNPIFLKDRAGRMLLANPATFAVVGKPGEAVIGKTDAEFFDDPATGQAIMENDRRIMESGKVEAVEESVLAAEGARTYIATKAPYRDANGQVIGIIGVAHEITQRKRTEEALRQSELRLKTAQEISHLGSWELDLQNDSLTWSDEVYRIFGLMPQEFGATYEAFLEHVHPDDRAAVDAGYSSSVREGRDTYELEHRVVRQATGEIRHVHEKCEHVRDTTGKIIRSVGMVHDITERKQAELALQQKAERDAALALITQTINHAGFDLKALFNVVAESIGETLGEVCDVTLLSSDKYRLEPQALFSRPQIASQEFHDIFPALPYQVQAGIVGQVVQTKRPILLSQINGESLRQSIDSAHVPLIEHSGMRSLVVVPIGNEGNVMGALAVARFESQKPYTEQDLLFLQSIANNTALAIINARLYHQVQDARAVLEQRVIERTESERKQRMLAEMLRDASEAFSQTLDLGKVSAALLEHLAHNVPYDSAHVILIDSPNKAHLQATCNISNGSLSILTESSSFDVETVPVLQGIVKSGTSRFIANVQQANDWKAWHHYDQIASWLGIPLIANNGVIGVLSLHKSKYAFFTDEYIRLAEALALPAAVAIQNALLYSKVTEAHDQLGIVSRQLMEAQENERREVARELHDEIGQVLTAVRTNLQVLRITHDDPSTNKHLEDSMTIVDHAIDEIRSLSLNLRPSILDEFGLVAALEWYLERQAERTGLEIELKVESENLRAPASLETTCFRVIQSALTNIIRHAKATRVQVTVRQYPTEESESAQSCQIEIAIRDNGVGFDVPSALERARRGGSMGLLGMLERARLAGGRFEIESTPGQGTEIHLLVPSP